MGYLHITNLYKEPEFLACGDTHVYALEKIHGTSAHVAWKRETYRSADFKDSILTPEELRFFSGGEKHENFVKLFDADDLKARIRRVADTWAPLAENPGAHSVILHGEAYGGKQQGMRDTYGPDLRFIVFDVMVDGQWVIVEQARFWAQAAGLEFVDFKLIPLTPEALDAERDRDSEQAIRNGMGPGKIREGIVIRPLVERVDHRGNRVIYKHKRPEFGESLKQKKEAKLLDLSRVQVLQDAQAIAEEWVTEERLSHVLDKIVAARQEAVELYTKGCDLDMKDTPEVIRAMLADVQREGEGEIVWSKEAERSVCTKTAKLFKARVSQLR